MAEAFACNTAVVASPNTPSVKELFSNSAVTADPDNPQECSRAFEKLANNPSYRKGRIQDGNRIAKQLTWDSIAKEYIHIIEHYA